MAAGVVAAHVADFRGLAGNPAAAAAEYDAALAVAEQMFKCHVTAPTSSRITLNISRIGQSNTLQPNRIANMEWLTGKALIFDSAVFGRAGLGGGAANAVRLGARPGSPSRRSVLATLA